MHDLTTFEQQLTQRLDDEVGRALPAFDAGRIAVAAMGRRSSVDRVVNRLGSIGLAGRYPDAGSRPRQLAAVLLLLLLAAAVVATVGAFLAPHRGDRPLALLAASHDLVLAKADGTDLVTLGAPPLAGGINHIRWSPDGRHLALTGGLLDFAIVDTNGGVTFLDQERRWSREVAWAPDGMQFAMLSGRMTEGSGGLIDVRLDIAMPDGSGGWAAELPGDASYAEDLGALAWSRDGATVAVTGYRLIDGPATGRTWLVDVRNRTVRELPAVKGSADTGPAWGPDGSLYVARVTAIDGGLWRLDLANGTSERLVRTASSGCDVGCVSGLLRGIAVSPDGRRVAYVDFTDRVSVVDLADGRITRVAQPQPYAYDYLIWASASELVFLNSGRTGDELPRLLSIDVVSGQTTVLSSTSFAFDLLPG